MTRLLMRSSILIFAALLLLTAVPGRAGAQDATALDSDGDGFSDELEIERGTDPNNPDTDGDTLTDGDEVGAQSDGYGTDPLAFDTDGDNWGDGFEIYEGSDPLDPASVPASVLDWDEDGLSNGDEWDLGTDPTKPDTDDDGISDFGEVGFEPGSSTGTDPLDFDSDDDGYGDGEEWYGGSDPTDPNSVPTAAASGSITVRVSICEADYCDQDYAGAELWIDGPVSAEAQADANGVASFAGLPVGDYVLNLSQTGDFRVREAFCDYTEGSVSYPISSSTTNQIDVAIAVEGRAIDCMWAIEPNNDPPDWIPTPTDPAPADPTPATPGGVVTALPNTGTGASDSGIDQAWLLLLALGLVALAALAVAPKLAARRA
jgi:hypothetical protein